MVCGLILHPKTLVSPPASAQCSSDDVLNAPFMKRHYEKRGQPFQTGCARHRRARAAKLAPPSSRSMDSLKSRCVFISACGERPHVHGGDSVVVGVACTWFASASGLRSMAHSAGPISQKPELGMSSTATAHKSSSDHPIRCSGARWLLRFRAVVA